MLDKPEVKIVKLRGDSDNPLASAYARRTFQRIVDFGRDIQPLLREHCVECHGPSQQMKGLRLDRRRDALPNRVGANGARIVPGNSARSLLFQRLTGTQSGPQMPPAGPLEESKINLIQTWIDQGAIWPDELSGDRSPAVPDGAVEKMRAALREGKQAKFQTPCEDQLQDPSMLGGRMGGHPSCTQRSMAVSRAVKLLAGPRRHS